MTDGLIHLVFFTFSWPEVSTTEPSHVTTAGKNLFSGSEKVCMQKNTHTQLTHTHTQLTHTHTHNSLTHTHTHTYPHPTYSHTTFSHTIYRHT